MKRPNIPETSTPSASPRMRRRQKTLTASKIALDDDDDDSLREAVDVIFTSKNTKRQKTNNILTRPITSRPSEPIASTSQLAPPSFPRPSNSKTQPQHHVQNPPQSKIPHPASSTIIYLDGEEPKRQKSRMPTVEETYVLPGRASSKCSEHYDLFIFLTNRLFQIHTFR